MPEYEWQDKQDETTKSKLWRKKLNDACFIPHFSQTNKDLEALYIIFLLFMILKYKIIQISFLRMNVTYSGESNFSRNNVCLYWIVLLPRMRWHRFHGIAHTFSVEDTSSVIDNRTYVSFAYEKFWIVLLR